MFLSNPRVKYVITKVNDKNQLHFYILAKKNGN